MDATVHASGGYPMDASLRVLGWLSAGGNTFMAIIWPDIDTILRLVLGLLGVCSAIFAIRYHRAATKKVKSEQILLDEQIKKLRNS